MNRPIDPDLDGYPDTRKMDAPALRKALMHAIREAAEEKTENRRLRRTIASVRSQLEEIVVTEGEDAGVILLSTDAPMSAVPDCPVMVYDLMYFTPLGEALMAAWKLTEERSGR
jgi:hypothetical protein